MLLTNLIEISMSGCGMALTNSEDHFNEAQKVIDDNNLQEEYDKFVEVRDRFRDRAEKVGSVEERS